MSLPAVVEPDPTTSHSLPHGSSRGLRSRIFLGALLFAAGAASGAGAQWWAANKYDYIAKRFGVVVDGQIYRSGQLTPAMLDKTVKENNISTIIDFQLNDIYDINQQLELKYAKENGIRHVRCPLSGDGTGDPGSYVDALALMIECQGGDQPILVHCAAGSQRTGGAVACYRLLFEKQEPWEVIKELMQYDWDPEEDLELIQYLNKHLPEISSRLVDRGVLKEVPNPMPRLPE